MISLSKIFKTIFGTNAIPQDLIAVAAKDFNSQHKIEHPGHHVQTNKIGIIPEITELVKRITGLNLKHKSGNYYEHSMPYWPHTDYNHFYDNSINVVIPIRYEGDKPYFIVFDQIWPNNSCSWMMDHSDPIDLGPTHLAVKGWPGEYPILNKTDKDIDEELYKKHLKHFPKYTLKNLSGKAYPFDPGNIIIFDNRKVHATGGGNWKKLGISLRFKLE
mgnify:CR=1 FL=1